MTDSQRRYARALYNALSRFEDDLLDAGVFEENSLDGKGESLAARYLTSVVDTIDDDVATVNVLQETRTFLLELLTRDGTRSL